MFIEEIRQKIEASERSVHSHDKEIFKGTTHLRKILAGERTPNLLTAIKKAKNVDIVTPLRDVQI